MGKIFTFKMVTPDGKMLIKDVDYVSVKTLDGVIGILKGHTPLETIVDISPLYLSLGNKKEEYALGGGILHVQKNLVTLLADSFESKEEIDINRAQDSMNRAQERLASHDENIDLKRAEVSLKRALNRLKIAQKR